METTTKNQKNTESKKTEGRILTGMFSDRESLEQCYNRLHERGYTKDDINLIMSDETRKKHFRDHDTEIGNKAKEGAGTGSLIGGAVGTAAGIIAALGTSMVLPGLGLIVAGPIVAGLAGAGAGGITGGLIGGLIGAGIPEERAKLYDSGVKNGRIVMGVHPRNEEDANFFENDWRTNKGEEIYR
jgi:hypothetical protein